MRQFLPFQRHRMARVFSFAFLPAFVFVLATSSIQIARGQDITNQFPRPVVPGVFQVGLIEHFAISESSGLAASRQHEGVVWTHNDGGNQFLFALTETGEYLGAFQVIGANLLDWEAVAADDQGNLYLADIGINSIPRSHVAVHRLKEPNPSAGFGNAEVTKTWYLRFPIERPDCEAFFVFGGFGYLISKTTNANIEATKMFRYPLSSLSGSTLLEEVTDIEVTDAVTDASISTDGQHLGILTSDGVYVVFVNGDPTTAGSAEHEFTEYENSATEGGTFAEGGFLVTAETREVYLFTKYLRITEVMPSAAASPGVPTADWWELTSFYSQPVDLSGWRFNDSGGGLTDPYVFTNGPVINPGESIVFVEDLTPEEFRAWWGDTNLPSGLQIVTYSGSGLSFRTNGDTLSLWDKDSNLVTREDFGAAERGVTFNYDPVSGQFGAKSKLGTNGVIRAAAADDIGSPGRITAGTNQPTTGLLVRLTPDAIEIEFDAVAGYRYTLEESDDLGGGIWTPTDDSFLATSNVRTSFKEPRDAAVRFYRLRITEE